MKHRRVTRPGLALFALLLAAACSDALVPLPGGPGGGGQPEAVASVSVAPADVALTPGGQAALRATLLGSSGRELTGRAVAWTSADANVATVDASGGVRATGTGRTTITATSEGRSGAATIVVAAERAPVASVEIRPTTELSLRVGETSQLRAIPKAADGAELLDREVVWTSDNAEVADISALGVVTARAEGMATLTATSEGRSARAVVRVAPAPSTPVATVEIEPIAPVVAVGETFQLFARAKAADGTVLDRPITWSSGDDRIAVVSASGNVTGVRPGMTVITATSEGKSRSADVWVITRSSYPLVGIGDDPLPMSFTTTEAVGDGTTRTVRWELRGGRMELGSDGRFHQLVDFWVYREGSLVEPVTFGYYGTYHRDYGSGDVLFVLPGNRPPFSGRFEEDGGLTLTRQLQPEFPELVFRYGAP